MCITNGYHEIVELLLQSGANVNLSRRFQHRSRCIHRSLHLASIFADVEMVELLIKHGAKINFKKGCTPLEKAAIKGNAEIVKVLIKHGADLESKNKRGSTPL